MFLFGVRDVDRLLRGAWIETRISCCREDYAGVASFAGAWIETYYGARGVLVYLRRLLRGGVDKNDYKQRISLVTLAPLPEL